MVPLCSAHHHCWDGEQTFVFFFSREAQHFWTIDHRHQVIEHGQVNWRISPVN
jgi:hypothetical protein